MYISCTTREREGDDTTKCNILIVTCVVWPSTSTIIMTIATLCFILSENFNPFVHFWYLPMKKKRRMGYMRKDKTRSCHPDSQPKETKENMKLGETKRNVLSPTRQSKLPITRKSKPTEESWCTKRKWSLVSKELHKRSSKWFFFHFLPIFFFFSNHQPYPEDWTAHEIIQLRSDP